MHLDETDHTQSQLERILSVSGKTGRRNAAKVHARPQQGHNKAAAEKKRRFRSAGPFGAGTRPSDSQQRQINVLGDAIVELLNQKCCCLLVSRVQNYWRVQQSFLSQSKMQTCKASRLEAGKVGKDVLIIVLESEPGQRLKQADCSTLV